MNKQPVTACTQLLTAWHSTCTQLLQITHQPSNPVQRSSQAAESISIIDVECEPGYSRASKAGPAVAREYAEMVAPLAS
jgi:hypothetical protein